MPIYYIKHADLEVFGWWGSAEMEVFKVRAKQDEVEIIISLIKFGIMQEIMYSQL